MAEVVFTDAAIDDLRRIGPDAVPKVLKKIRVLYDDPGAGYPLGDSLTGYRKLVVGRNTWRIVYRIADGGTVEICEVWAVGARSDSQVYDEASARVKAAGTQRPEMRILTDVIDRLGRMAEQIAVSGSAPRREPVPDWLALRLVHTAGVPREEVAALSLEEAVDRWADYAAKPHF